MACHNVLCWVHGDKSQHATMKRILLIVIQCDIKIIFQTEIDMSLIIYDGDNILEILCTNTEL